MIKIENVEVFGWEAAIRGMRNPMNSWERSDSGWDAAYIPENMDVYVDTSDYINVQHDADNVFQIGPEDQKLMKCLATGGPVHAKYRRMITVYVDITAPLYWWKEFDTYKVGTVTNSCSTMHKIAEKEFTLDDFSCEHLMDDGDKEIMWGDWVPLHVLEHVICVLNRQRDRYNATKDKQYWWQMIQLLPSSYNQRRTVMLNYEVLANIYKSRRNHKLDEWSEHTDSTCTMDTIGRCENPKEFLLCGDCSIGKGFCDWIQTLPYSELITGEFNNKEEK